TWQPQVSSLFTTIQATQSSTGQEQYASQQHVSYNPFQQPSQSSNPYQQFSQVQPQPSRPDKSSILALYNYPHLAPTAPSSLVNAHQVSETPNNTTLSTTPTSGIPVSDIHVQKIETTPIGPAAGSRNPFLAG